VTIPVGTTLSEVEALVSRLKVELERASADPHASIRDRAQLGSALAQSLRHLSRIRGEDALNARRIAKAPYFKKMMAALFDALRPWPQALEAVAAAMEVHDE
jgi:hypothetical protein